MTVASKRRISAFARKATAKRYGSNRRQVTCKALLVAGLLGWHAGVTASAQEETAGPTPVAGEPARYSVEVIIFVHASSSGNEIFTPPEPLQDPSHSDYAAGTGPEEGPVFDDRAPNGTLQAEPAAAARSESLREVPARARIELERLDPGAFRMQDTWRKLERLDAYQPILHAAWTQTTHEKSVSPALPLRALSDPPLGLDGTISLYQSRFLHLDVDLTLDASGHAGQDVRRTATDRLVNPDSMTEGALPGDEAAGPSLPPVRYRITEDRIMRDGDTRYFDHPRFGMLARVTRLADGGSAAAD